MEKEELIKSLRVYSNSLKNIKNENEEKNRNNNLVDLPEKNKVVVEGAATMGLCCIGSYSIYQLIQASFYFHDKMYEGGIFYTISPLILLPYAAFMGNILHKIKESRRNERTKLEGSYDDETIIMNIETAIEFLQRLTEDENERYLTYKMPN